jgi:RNA polymerase sigma-70 factor (ECF subfamily)
MPDDAEDTLTAVPDALLLQRFQEGDEASFEALFLRHYDRVYGVLFRLTGTRAEAEDLAQEVFLRLYRRRPAHGENLAGWLYRVALNTGYNALRAARRRDRREQAAAQDREPPAPTEEAAARREAQREVRAALASIPPRAARLLLLRQMGFSYAELAAIFSIAPGSVGTLLARAQRAFERAYRRQAASAGGEDDEASA